MKGPPKKMCSVFLSIIEFVLKNLEHIWRGSVAAVIKSPQQSKNINFAGSLKKFKIAVVAGEAIKS